MPTTTDGGAALTEDDVTVEDGALFTVLTSYISTLPSHLETLNKQAVRLVEQLLDTNLPVMPSDDATNVVAAACCTALVVITAVLLTCCSRRQRKKPAAPPRTPLPMTRTFVRDLARLAEHIIMNDVPASFWSFDSTSPAAVEQLQFRLTSRETAPFFAPDKVGQVPENMWWDAATCLVRQQRAAWCVAFKNEYEPVVADWIDTGVELQKPAAVFLLTPKGAMHEQHVDERSAKPKAKAKPKKTPPPLIVVGFRGSKTLQDYARTDASPSFVPLPLGDMGEARGRASQTDIDLAQARWMPFLGESAQPCATLGLWQAYAGDERAEPSETPRARVRRAVEALLVAHPDASLVITGHSLGGALSTLCAFDLIAQSAIVRAAQPVTLINFAAPRFFNQAFQDAMTQLEERGAIKALRVVVAGDVIAQIPPKHLGTVHGVRPRLLLNPSETTGPISFSEDDLDDDELWKIAPSNVHICHALYLGGEKTPGDDAVTIPQTASWPIELRPARQT